MATTPIADKLAKLEKKIAKRQATIAEEQTQLDKELAEYDKLYLFVHDDFPSRIVSTWDFW